MAIITLDPGLPTERQIIECGHQRHGACATCIARWWRRMENALAEAREEMKALREAHDGRSTAQAARTPQRTKSKAVSALPQQSESDFQHAVIEYAQLRGWKVMHMRPARTGRTYINRRGEERQVWNTPYEGDDGFFDLTLARNGEVRFMELKSETGKASEAQLLWLDAAGSHAMLVRPSDWPEIERVLR